MRTIVLFTVLLSALALPAFAQPGATTFGVTFGTPIALTEDLQDLTDPELAWQGHATVGLVGALAVRGEVGQNRFKPSAEFDMFCPDCNLELNHFAVGIQYGGFGDQGALGLSRARVMPYGFVALGSYEFTGDAADQFDAMNERRVGWNAGFGINIRATDHFGFQVDVHVHAVRPEDGEDPEYWLTPQGGVYVSF